MKVRQPPRFKFEEPVRSRVVVFNAAGSEALKRTVLGGIDHSVLPSRREAYYLTPAILALFLKNLIHIDWRSIARRRGRGLFGQLYKVYLLACLQRMRPAVVLTWVDNDWIFQALSRLYPAAEFLAVQNGARALGSVSVPQFLPLPEPGYVISMPHLFCFGQYEADLYRKHGHRVDHFHPVGPVLGAYYKTVVCSEQPPLEHDLCLVSQWRAAIVEGGLLPKVREGVQLLDDFLSRYLRERDLSLCVALCGDGPREEKHFQSRYGKRAQLSRHNDELMSSYGAMDRSRVIVTHSSTAALEAFGWGKKVLFCNFLRDENAYLPREGPWLVDRPDYGEFKDKLDALRAMAEPEFRARSAEFARYATAYDFSRPAHQRIREAVLEFLGTTPERKNDRLGHGTPLSSC